MAIAVNGQAQVLSAGDARWTDLLRRVGHDIYHTPAYHALPGFGHRGKPFVFTYREADNTFLWPYLLSNIQGEWNDVTSVYGYPGPVSSPDPCFVQRAWTSLLDHWKRQRIVSAFTRFHPLLGNCRLMPGLRDATGALAVDGCRAGGSTVAIDLTLPSGQQVRNYQKVLRQQIRKVRDKGFVTEEDCEWRHVEEFVALYRDTMTRRNSRSEYLIDSGWVAGFRKAIGSHARLFVTKWDGAVAAALLAMEYPPFLHAHLTGIDRNLASHSPLKVLLDDIRQWGTARGLHSLHLGGGLGGREDSLFEFKRKFSPVTHEFWTGGWILERAAYLDLEEQHRRDFASRGIEIGDPGFFPIYRYEPGTSSCAESKI